MQVTRWVRAILLPAAFAASALSAGAQTAPRSTEPAYTYPSLRVEHKLKIADIVAEVPVKEGDRVKKGDVLLVEDDREEQKLLDKLKLLAESTVSIQAAKAKYDHDLLEFERIEKMYKDESTGPDGRVTRGASEEEYHKAKLQADISKLEIAKAELQQESDQKDYERQKQIIAEMRIVSTVDGIVEKVDLHPGEVLDPTKPAITVVQNDPLWVDLRLYTAQSLQLRDKQELEVYYKDDPKPRKGKVIFISPTVEPGTDRHLVRLEMPNPEGRPSGLEVNVALPAKLADAKGQ